MTRFETDPRPGRRRAPAMSPTESTMDAADIAAWETAMRKGWLGAQDYERRHAELAAQYRKEGRP